MHIDDENMAVEKGCAVYIPPNAHQHIKNTGDTELVFICIVNPPWKAEDETIVDEVKYA